MKKMMKQFFVAVVALAAFTACSDSNYVGEESETPSQFANQAMNTAILTDVNGQQRTLRPMESGILIPTTTWSSLLPAIMVVAACASQL